MAIEAPTDLVVAFVLATLRASAWLVLVPPFSTRAVPAVVKIGLAAAIAVPAAPALTTEVPGLDIPSLMGAAAVQVFVGLTLGFVVLMLFSAMQAAGDLIDLFGGFALAQLFDPLTGAQSSPFGRFYHLIAVTLLFALDGHLLLVRGFLTSFDAISVSTPALDELGQVLTAGLGTFMLAAVEIAAPLLGALFLAEVALGLLARAAPQVNVFILGLPAKILLTVGLASVGLPLLPGAVTSLAERSVRTGTEMVRLFGS